MKTRTKLIIMIAIIFVILLLAIGGFVGLVFMAASSNNNFGFLSNIAEDTEKAFISEERFQEEIQTSIATQLEAAKNNIDNPENDNRSIFNNSDIVELENIDPFNNLEYKIESSVSLTDKSSTLESETLVTGELSQVDEIFRSTLITNNELDGETIEFSGNLDVYSDEIFIKIDTLNVPNETEELLNVLNIREYLGSWYNSDLDTVESTAESFTGEDIDNTEEQKKEIDKIIRVVESDEFKDILRLKDDRVVDSIRTRCIGIEMNADQFIAINNKINEIYENEEVLSDQDQEEIRASIEVISTELCLGRGDGYLYYANVILSTNENEFDVPTIDVNSELTLSNYNSEEFDTTIPVAERTIEEVTEEIFTNLFNSL